MKIKTTPRKQKIVVLGTIKNNKGEILVIQRNEPDIKEAHLKWDIPGGTNEFGESLEETLKREIYEETGLDVSVNNFMSKCVSKYWEHKDYLQHALVFCYECEHLKGEVQTKDPKVLNPKWVDTSKIKNLDFLPTTRIFIEMLIENSKRS